MEWSNWIYLVAPLVANITAHLVKFIHKRFKNRNTKFKSFFCSGGVLSAHNAMVFTLATIVGLLNGFNSAVFAVSAFFAVVIAYDSINVRRATGEQGDVISKVLSVDKKPFNAYGHTPIEMILGVIWGILVGIITVSLL